MSGIVGLVNLDGRPADGGLVGRMLGTIAHRGPDASRTWSSGAVALGHCLLAATPESIGEVQPHAAAGITIVFDGRIDNRRELAEEFARERVPLAADFDAAFALAAYRRWGVDCAARLLGDFAFAIWDAAERRMFCARDVMAQKPFYYHRGRDLYLFASEPQALLQHPAVSRRPNEGMIGECLSVITSTTDTLLADVQRLARAHRIVVSPDAFHLDQYWEIDPTRTIRYRTVDDYGEHLRALLRQTVGDRLRSSTRTGVMLSGGIDSSSVLATATQLGRTGQSVAGCDAFSIVDPGGPLDEKPFIDRTVAALGCVSHQYRPAMFAVDTYRTLTRQRANLASSPNGRVMNAIKSGARQQGVRVLLSGIGGDEWLGGSFYHCADLFRSMRWAALVAYVRATNRFPELELPRASVGVLAWPLLSRSTRRAIKRAIGRDGVPPWIRRDFADRIALADRLYPVDPDLPFPTIAQRNIYRGMMSGLAIHHLEDDERSTATFGLEVRQPYADRRMMEFGLAIPEELRWRGGTRKFLLREAMCDLVPSEVRERRISPNGGGTFVPTLRALADERLFDDPLLERDGRVHAGATRAFYDRVLARQARGDPDYTDEVWPLWAVAAVELWLREVGDRPSATQEEATCEMTTTA